MSFKSSSYISTDIFAAPAADGLIIGKIRDLVDVVLGPRAGKSPCHFTSLQTSSSSVR